MPTARRSNLTKLELDAPQITPVQQAGPYWLKRDDLWQAEAPARGGKARTADLLCRKAKKCGIEEICIAVDRNSSVPGMVSRVCRFHGVRLRIYLPSASVCLPPVFKEAEANGAHLEEVFPGYMSVRRKRLRDYVAASNGKAVEIGVGLLLGEGLDTCGTAQTALQAATNVQGLVDAGKIKRVVVPVGSGGMLRGVAAGLQGVPILGVCAGNPPEMDLPPTVELVRSSFDFGDTVDAKLGDVALDPVYEAKCLEYLREGDLLWIVAHRDTE